MMTWVNLLSKLFIFELESCCATAIYIYIRNI
jgi:hypothetical protein